jgi:molybdate transport system permease protein
VTSVFCRCHSRDFDEESSSLMPDLTAVWLSIKLAAVTTVVLLILGTPLAWWLAHTRRAWRGLVEALVVLPIVLPPTVLGFYLLLLLSPQNALGALLAALDIRLVFSFSGLVLGSVIFSLPFVVFPLRNAFQAVPPGQLEVAATLGARPLDRFFSVALPASRGAFIVAAVLAFAHTIGEFGVVLMLGGNIPGQTQVLSIAIYNHVEQLEYAQAHWLAGGLVVVSLAALLFLQRASSRQRSLLT